MLLTTICWRYCRFAKQICSYSSIGTDTRCCSNGAGFLFDITFCWWIATCRGWVCQPETAVCVIPTLLEGSQNFRGFSISLRNFVARPSLRKRDSLFFLRANTPVYPIRLRTKNNISTMILNIFLQKNAISVKSYLNYY